MKPNFLYDINSYLKNDTALVSLSGKASLDIYPMVGYADDQPPILLYFYYPGIYSPELPWFNKDMIKYEILDNDADRLIRMGSRIQELLSTNYAFKISSASASGKWGALLRGSTHSPIAQRDGFMRFELLFEIAWLPNA
jgi:hypothetical protein